MKPRIPITDPSFRYRNSSETDVRKTWAAARRRLRLKEQAPDLLSNVLPIKRREGGK